MGTITKSNDSKDKIMSIFLKQEQRMKKIKVLTVFGTRPEAIKMCPLVKELQSNSRIECTVCITAQHRQMPDKVLDAFSIVPDHDLNIMKQEQTLAEITSRVLTELDKVIKQVQPDIVLVHGDTTTTFAGALAAFYNMTKIGHVEAGLRTYNVFSPYPEEANRVMVSELATLNFAPTEESRENLLREGKDGKTIYVTGNTAIDALKTTVKADYSHEMFDRLKPDEKLILLTAHRRENLGDPMRNMFNAIKRILREFKGYKLVYPMHPNPKVREIAYEILSGEENVMLVEPIDVVDFHNIMARSYIILTDSGGIQEEASSLGKPVLVLRDTTERPEGVAAGVLKLVGTEEENIYNSLKELLSDEKAYARMTEHSDVYGDGMASNRIVNSIIEYFDSLEE